MQAESSLHRTASSTL